eukprot:TRINITY_DN50020_c0_g1_i1.p1 TRINITY_DN50020_c0_g1~~TRINITY_DN50020_c0_g1_i1.p1  ORF type:complete len:1102 (+),score=186.79 TRINITY_DN50020_c0_g1_i1:137-3442(+)
MTSVRRVIGSFDTSGSDFAGSPRETEMTMTPVASCLPLVSTPHYPSPSCWGKRGPPTRLRLLAGLTHGASTSPAESSTSPSGSVLQRTQRSVTPYCLDNGSCCGGSGFGVADLLPDVRTPPHGRHASSEWAAREQSRERLRPPMWRNSRRSRRPLCAVPDGGSESVPRPTTGWLCNNRSRPASISSRPCSGWPTGRMLCSGGCIGGPGDDGEGMYTQPKFNGGLGGDEVRNCAGLSMKTVASQKNGGKAAFADLLRILREELAVCSSQREVAQLVSVTDRLFGANTSEHFGLSGRLAYRFREALKALRTNNFAALEGRNGMTLRKMVARETQRRRAQIVSETNARRHGSQGGGTIDGGAVLLEPAVGLLKTSPVAGSTVPSWEASPVSCKSGGGLSQTPSSAQHHSSIFAETSTRLPQNVSSQKLLGDALVGPTAASRHTATGNSAQASEHTETVELQWLKVFHKVENDGEVHRDDMGKPLELLGFGRTDMNCVNEVFDSVSNFTTVKADEFVEFVRAFSERMENIYKETFKRFDTDDSGYIDAEELRAVLTELGALPMSHILEEVLREVDEDGSNCLDFMEFKKVLETTRTREGFSLSEFTSLRELFVQHDTGGTGEIETRMITEILGWLGYATDPREVDTLIAGIDIHGSGYIDWGNYLVLMRHVREVEVKKMVQLIESHDRDGSGTISYAEIGDAILALGFTWVDMDAVRESAQACGFDTTSHEFDLSQIWQTLTVYRQRDGLVIAESEDINAAFFRHTKGRAIEINALELTKLLRLLGYPMSFEEQKKFLAKVDFDNSEMISCLELRKLISMYQAEEQRTFQQAFRKDDVNNEGVLSFSVCTELFDELGCSGAVKILQDEHNTITPVNATKSNGDGAEEWMVPFDAFMRAVVLYKRRSRAEFKQNCGFSWEEIAHLREEFKRYDKDGSGDISKSELVSLVEAAFPLLAHDPSMRPRLLHLMQECDSDRSGSLDFEDFLRFSAQFMELTQKDQLERETNAIVQTSFTKREVEEFRELFLSGGNNQTGLAYEDVKFMLSNTCPLGDKNLQELNGILASIVSASGSSAIATGLLDFPDFLLLMHQLLEVNFADIQQKIKH